VKGLQYPIEVLTRWAAALLAIYCVLMLVGTLYPFNFTTDSALMSRRPHPIEWIPFSYICARCGFDIDGKVLNTIMFIPFGFLLALHRSGNTSKIGTLLLTTLWGFAFSLGIEITQFFLPTRTPSASDVTLNTLGALLGAQLAIALIKESPLPRIRRK
jgi:glycopeptide antibiotics resistance protein